MNGKTIADLDVLDENGRYKYTTSYKIDRKGTKLEEVEGSREVKGLRPLGSSGVSLIFDHHKDRLCKPPRACHLETNKLVLPEHLPSLDFAFESTADAVTHQYSATAFVGIK